MKAPHLKTDNPPVRLVEPNIERDALLGTKWLSGELGRTTLRQMGNTESEIDQMLPATIENQAELVKSFLEREDQLNWMIEYEGKIVGSVWVDLDAKKDKSGNVIVPGPSVHIMIGDPDTRGKGVGSSAVGTVLAYLEEQGHNTIYSRHLTTNDGADYLLKSLGFTDLGDPYMNGTLEFQNLVREKQ